MSTKVLVHGYMNQYQCKIYSCLNAVPLVLYGVILTYFDSSDKFQEKLSDKHLSLINENKSIKKVHCGDGIAKNDCNLDAAVFCTRFIKNDCYRWRFKLHEIAWCAIGVFTTCNACCCGDRVYDKNAFMVCRLVKTKETLEMVLNCAQKVLLFFKNNEDCSGDPLLLKCVKLCGDKTTEYIAAINFEGDEHITCQDGLIELMDSGYIDAPTEINYECNGDKFFIELV